MVRHWAQGITGNAPWCFALFLIGCSGEAASGAGAGPNVEQLAPATQGSGSDPPVSISSPQRSNATVRIMPLGDSITQSVTPLNSYRYYLWHLLRNENYRVDFVGSLKGVAGGPPGDSNFDMDHEGHAGWRADEVLANIQVWAMQAAPDIVLIHLGHNDLCRLQSIDSTVKDIGDIIDVLRVVNPRVHILLAQIVASASSCHTEIPALNARLPALAADKEQTESSITVVDQYTGFDVTTMTFDGTHPNSIGDSRMADRWREKLVPVLDRIITDPHFRMN